MSSSREVDFLIIGGGFYGLCLALYLRSVSNSLVVIEAGEETLNRASRVNQARIHTGFHYPRNALTAMKSLQLHQKFIRDFPDAVVGDFRMLYAIAARRSKVSAGRFLRMFQDMGAQISPAGPSETALFNPDSVEATFSCVEYAFNFIKLREQLEAKMLALDVELQRSTAVVGIQEQPEAARVLVRLSSGSEIRAKRVFNVTYSHINHVLDMADLPHVNLKHELAEIALIEPPEELAGRAITVMDGPFFSCMPYAADKLYSLTHVRYTPHRSWTDRDGIGSAYEVLASSSIESRAKYMIQDARRYVPCLGDAVWKGSLFDTKSVLVRNENDDGRPIMVQILPETSRVTSIMGGKIDNIYDLFEFLDETPAEWSGADLRHLEAVPG
jgi:glycine/D-amino acid oxidase-like deaminating enzyme